MKKNVHIRYIVVFTALAFLLLAGVVLNANTGSVNISPIEIFKIIFFKANANTMESNIIWKIRLPRLLAAAILGGALSVSGYLLQTFFRNPIAGPFILGISSGAKLFVAFVMIFMLNYVSSISTNIVVIASFAGSLIATGLVLICASRTKNMSMLLVIGIMIGYICSAITDFFITFANENNIANLTHWSMGSFSGLSWSDIKYASIIIFIAMIIVMLCSKQINAYLMGEGYAKTIGVNIKLFRVVLIFLSSILSACVTAFAGPISFVGIAVPHIARMLFKTTKATVIIPASFLCGGVFSIYCDLIARTVFSPVELSVGTVTAVFGAPIVIWLMITRRKGANNE